MRIPRALPAALAVGATALAVAACGSGGGSSSSGGGSTSSSSGAAPAFSGANIAVSQGQKKGGTLNLISAEGWEHLDPGQSYFQIDYNVVYATQRPLYGYMPDNGKKVVPDLAAGPPTISKDAKTVTVKIRPNVKWSPPLNRTVTSDDVKYAFERDFNPNVPNAYATSYYPIVGADKSKGGPIPGIETPDKTTIDFHLTTSVGATFVNSLVLPGSAPVPKEVAGPMANHSPSTYDSDVTKQAFSGPYMITEYQPDRSLTLERNSNWKADTDYRPAYADKVVWKAGGDPNVLARQILASTDLLMADTPPAPVLKTAYQRKKSQLSISTLGDYYAALNTSRPPF